MSPPKLKELFLKPVDRNIDGVIKADDQRHLVTEVEEFVPTKEIRKGLELVMERYLEEPTANGVWISGFFGSGKSHLLKIISLLLDDQPLPDGRHPSEILLPKMDDEILQGNLERAVRIPSRSLLFNIDQKANHIGGDDVSPILDVFMKVLNEMRGFHDAQGHIAEFEHSLYKKGNWEAFREFWLEKTGGSWEEARIDIEFLDNETFARVYAEFSETSEEEALRMFDRLRERYKVSIESFAKQVKAYIDEQGPDFRLNFFVDEVGQFVGQNVALMLNLQTVAESLATECDGRAWIFVTSQGDLQSLLGDMRRETAEEFSRIQGRFKTRITLASADVREVIQKRLLAKTENEPPVLLDLYERERENFATLYRFQDESLEFKVWKDSEQFCQFYPFPMYQFDLFQRCIEQLSAHNAFTGRHTSIGERSMLEVFQNVAKNLSGEKVGYLIPFDELFGGIAATLRGDMQTPVLQAEDQLDSREAVRILRALFLLKWVKGFKATRQNVTLLLMDQPDLDIAERQQKVEEALRVLVQNSYLQKNGEVYEFLTNIEKDIENEIKVVEVEDSEVAKLVAEIAFDDVLRDRKIRYVANGQDYEFARKIDDQLLARDAELSINLITSEHPNFASAQILAAQNTGKPELMFIVPRSETLLADARTYLKTRKYIQQTDSGSTDEARRSILSRRGELNSSLRNRLTESCRELLSASPAYVNGSELRGGNYQDPRMRLQRCGQELIAFAFPRLASLRGSYTEDLLRKTLLDQDDLLTSGQVTLTEAEQELETYILRNQENGDRCTVEEIVRSFSRRPYGWPTLATLILLARLFRMGKIELRNPQLMSNGDVLEAFGNSRRIGSVRVRLQEKIDARDVAALKRFHQEFFHKPNGGQEARTVGEETLKAMEEETRNLEALLALRGHFPFVRHLESVVERLRALSKKDAGYLFKHLNEYQDELLDARENIVDPIHAFINGPHRQGYESVIRFLREEKASFGEIEPDALQPLRDLETAEHPYRGQLLVKAKTAMESVREKIQTQTENQRKEAFAELDRQKTTLEALPEIQALEAEDKERILSPLRSARDAIEQAGAAGVIRDRLRTFKERDLPEILQAAARKQGGDEGETAVSFVALSAVRVDSPVASIGNPEELDAYLEALRQAVLAELEKGKRVSV